MSVGLGGNWGAFVNWPRVALVGAMAAVPVIAVGRILPDHAEQLLTGGVCDFVAMGRQLLADPDLPNRLVQLHQGIESGSAEQVRSTAHALKGASGMLGAIRLRQLCQQLETTPDQSLLFDVIGEAERVETKMREYLRSAAVEA